MKCEKLYEHDFRLAHPHHRLRRTVYPDRAGSAGQTTGIQVLAVTDHDTVAGADEAISAGEALGLRVIRGVELGAKGHHNFHILSYGFRDGDTELSRLCETLRVGRNERKYLIIEFLREKGVDIDLAEVEELAGGEVIARPHFAQILVKHGYVSTNREAFDRYLDTEEFRKKVERFKADPRTCIEAVKSAGGKVSLAHPYQMGLPEDELDALVAQLKDWGLDALECYYPKYTPGQQTFLSAFGGEIPASLNRRERFSWGKGQAGYRAGALAAEAGMADKRLNVIRIRDHFMIHSPSKTAVGRRILNENPT